MVLWGNLRNCHTVVVPVVPYAPVTVFLILAEKLVCPYSILHYTDVPQPLLNLLPSLLNEMALNM